MPKIYVPADISGKDILTLQKKGNILIFDYDKEGVLPIYLSGGVRLDTGDFIQHGVRPVAAAFFINRGALSRRAGERAAKHKQKGDRKMKKKILFVLIVLAFLGACMRATIKAPFTMADGTKTETSLVISRPVFSQVLITCDPTTGLITLNTDTSRGFTQAFSDLTGLVGLMGQLYMKPGSTPAPTGNPVIAQPLEK